MNNHQFPGQEPEQRLPEESLIPEPDNGSTLPVIEDLSFEESADTPEPTPQVEELTFAEASPAVQELEFTEEILFSEASEPEIMDVLDQTGELPDLEAMKHTGELPTAEELRQAGATVELQEIQDATDELTVFPREETPYEAALVPESVESLPQEQEQEPDLERDILSDPELAMPVPPAQPADDSVDQEYRDPVPPQEPAPTGKKKKKDDTRPTLKGRPKRKKGEGLFGIPNILATVVWMSLIVAIGVTLGRMLWVCAADVLAFGREDKQVTVTVYESDTMESIIDKLHDAGLIRYKGLFGLYADISDAHEDIKPGIYDLNTRYDYHALVNFMSPSSTREVIELTIPEGYTCRQIYNLLEENRVCTALDIASYAADGELSDYWFLEDVARGSEYCLEGFLFPDTYQFYKNSSPREALEKMLDNFGYRFSEDMRAQIETLNAEVTGGGYGVREIVIVASLIEKESAAPAESATIASVIYNRLHNWDYPALLNIDAAIVYAQGGDAENIDTSIDSPYNTYRNTGLTPTPISNPGLSSLKAALKPEFTDYYFYVLNPSTGMHQFSTTQAEHDAWIDQFYN